MAQRKKLTQVGGSIAFIIDRPIADLYGWNAETEVEISPGIDSMTITKASTVPSSSAEPQRKPKAKYAPRSVVVPDHVVRLLVNFNPKQHGSASRERFDLYRDGMTVREALAAGVRPDDIQWDVAHDFIALELPPVSKAS